MGIDVALIYFVIRLNPTVAGKPKLTLNAAHGSRTLLSIAQLSRFWRICNKVDQGGEQVWGQKTRVGGEQV